MGSIHIAHNFGRQTLKLAAFLPALTRDLDPGSNVLAKAQGDRWHERVRKALERYVQLHRTLHEVRAAHSRAKPGASMRVLHFTNAFSVPSETFTYDVITGLERFDAVDNYVSFFKRDLLQERPFAKAIQMHGFARPQLDAATSEFVAAFGALIERVRPRLIHGHFGWVGVPLIRVLKQLGLDIPLVITMHGTDVNMWPRKYRWYREALRSLGREPSVTLTTHTETYRAKLKALSIPPAKVTVIPNSFDPSFAGPFERKPFAPGSEFRVICVARMDIWKGHEYLIRGFARFRQQGFPNSTLTLAGFGSLEDELRGLVEKLGVQDAVRFLGRVPHDAVPQLLREHDVYVQPSIAHPETMQKRATHRRTRSHREWHSGGGHRNRRRRRDGARGAARGERVGNPPIEAPTRLRKRRERTAHASRPGASARVRGSHLHQALTRTTAAGDARALRGRARG